MSKSGRCGGQRFAVWAVWLIVVGAGSAPGQPRIETIAGNGNAGYSGDGGPATSASLKEPVGIAVDYSGNLFFSDPTDCRIRRIDGRTGVITTVAGDGRLGYGGDGGPATSATLGWPEGVAVDAAGNLFIADTNNSRIRRVDARSGVISTVAGNGTSGFSGDGFDAASASLNRPRGVAVDLGGNLFIADSENHRVRRVDAQTGRITTVAGNGASGYSGDGGAATNANLNRPRGVAIEVSGNLLIADTYNHRVRRVDGRTGVITTLAGNGTTGYTGDGVAASGASLSLPAAVAGDNSGDVIIADTYHERIRRVDARTGVILLLAGNGTSSFGGDGGPATSAGLSRPQGVALDNAGRVCIADTSNHRIRRVGISSQLRLVVSPAALSFTAGGSQTVTVSSSGAALNFASTVSSTPWLSVLPSGGTTPATLAVSVNPAGLQAGTHIGTILLTAEGALPVNLTVSLVLAGNGIGPAQPLIETYAGTGNSGYSGDGGPAKSASMKEPRGVAVDAAGNLFFADTADCRIRRVDARTGVMSTAAGDGRLAYGGDGGPAVEASLAWPEGVAADGAGNLFVADSNNHRIRRVDGQTGTIATVAGSGRPGFSGDGFDAGSASVNYPKGVAVDSAGNLFIADSGNQRIRRVDAQTGIITTVAGNGASGYSGDGTAATSANLHDPRTLAVDRSGNLFIADERNNRIRRVDGRTGVISTVAGNGDYFYAGDGVPAVSAPLSSPAGVAVDGAGNVFVADTLNNRVRRVDAATGVILLVAGTGTSNYSGDGGPATSASVARPQGVAVDALGNLYIADSGNHCVRRVVFSSGPRLALSATTLSFTATGTQTISLTSTGATLNFTASRSTTAGGDWLSVAPSSGTTPAALSVTVDADALAPGVYGGSITIASPDASNSPLTVAVSLNLADAPAGCHYTISPVSGVFGAGGGIGSVGVIANSGCIWAAASNVSWIAIASGSSGSGSGTVGYSVAANSAAASRSGTLTVAGQTFTVTQSGTSALFLVGPSPLVFSFKEGSVEPQEQLLSVYANSPELSFTAAASGGDWLAVSPTSGTVPATLLATVNPAGLPAGARQGTITVTAPAADPSVRTVAIRVSVEAGGAARLGVEPSSGLSFAFTQGSEPKTGRLSVSNGGGGSLAFRTTTATSTGGRWLAVRPEGGTVTVAAPVSLEVVADPTGLTAGTYSGRVTVSSSTTNQSVVVPVTITVSPVTQTVLLSQTGLTFTAVARGGAVPPQTFGVLNMGEGVMNWAATAGTLPGPRGTPLNWLKVTPERGSTDAASLEVPLVEVAVDPAGLEAGEYYGQVQVSAAAASNSPQIVSVILNVLPPGSDPGPLLRPTGLIFAAVAGGGSPGSQVVALSNLTAAPRSFTSGRLTTDGKLWFTHLPADGSVSPAQATRILVQPEASGLTAGVRRGVLTLLFADGTVRNVNILLVLIPSSGGARSSKAGGIAADGACVPTRLLLVFTSLSDQFVVPAGWPTSIAAQVVDDCGVPLTSGSVVATFSNGDPPLPLVSLKDGRWNATWQARVSGQSQVRIVLTARTPGAGIQGTAQISGGLQPNTNLPVVDAGGVSPIVAPGGILTVYGARLAEGRAITGPVPLETELGTASVLLAGRPLPLFFVSDAQINAQVPYDITVNTRHQLIVRRGAAITVPEGVTVAPAQPSVFTTGTRQGLIFAGSALADERNPAKAGDTVVLYCAGLGAVDPVVPAGTPAPFDRLFWTSNPVTVTVGGVEARVVFAGLTPGFTGLYQVNAVVPDRAPIGGAVEVVVTAAGQSSPPVTMAVQ